MNPFDAHDIVTTLGTIGVLTALFVETGLLVGLFLPGDSLLFVAGLAASGTAREIFGDQLSYTQLMIWAPIFATAGSQFGHWLGAKIGRPFFDRPDSRFFNQERVQQTERWLMKYGLGKALILSHFIPFVRTLLNPLCGIIGIPAKKFFFWNIIGSYIWTQKSAGKQPAWINYMTNVNQIRGNFAIPRNEGFMVLDRRYELNDLRIS